MATGLLNVVQNLRYVLQKPEDADALDEALLERFVLQRDEAAFAELVRRHGPMVMSVCRRVLRNTQDAEDAFQATFMVLAKKAPTIQLPGKLGNWLYGTASLTARHARAKALERQVKEAALPVRREEPEHARGELLLVLDQELERLPEEFRAVIVLCKLEGRTRREVALHLGLLEGTVASRLARGMDLLKKRLSRYGLTVTAASMAELLSQEASRACVPASIVSSMIKAASLFAAGQTAATGAISVQVAALTEGVLKTMLMKKLKMAILVASLAGSLCVLTGGTVVGQVARPRDKQQTLLQDEQQEQPRVKAKAKTPTNAELSKLPEIPLQRKGKSVIAENGDRTQADDKPRRCQWYDASNFKISFSDDMKLIEARVPNEAYKWAWRAPLTHKTKLDVSDPEKLTFSVHGNAVRVLGCKQTYADFERKDGRVIATGKTTDSSFKQLPQSKFNNWGPGATHPVNQNLIATEKAGFWRTKSPYAWPAGPVTRDLRFVKLQWIPGKPHDTEPNVIAHTEEGRWLAAEGYEFVDPSKNLHVRKAAKGNSGIAEGNNPRAKPVQQTCLDSDHLIMQYGGTWNDDGKAVEFESKSLLGK